MGAGVQGRAESEPWDADERPDREPPQASFRRRSDCTVDWQLPDDAGDPAPANRAADHVGVT